MTQTVTIEGLRSQLLTSIKGRRLGLDSGDFLVGPKDLRRGINNTTAISGTLNSYGFNTLGVSTAAATYTMDAPVPGVDTFLAFTTTAVTTLSIAINASTGAYFQTTAGATFQTITASTTTAAYIGQTIHLVAISTSIFRVMHSLQTCFAAS